MSVFTEIKTCRTGHPIFYRKKSKECAKSWPNGQGTNEIHNTIIASEQIRTISFGMLSSKLKASQFVNVGMRDINSSCVENETTAYTNTRYFFKCSCSEK